MEVIRINPWQMPSFFIGLQPMEDGQTFSISTDATTNMGETIMKKKTFLTLAATLVLAACGNGASQEESTSSAQSGTAGGKDTYIVGLDDTFAPMGFRNAEGEITGFDVDLATAVGEILDVEFVFQPIDWVMKETELNAGNIDLIWNGYSITEEREEKVLFSEPYLENRQVIIVPTDSEIQTKQDMAGKVVATQQASATLDALNADESGIVEQFANGEPVLYPTFVDVFNDLDSGRSDAMVVDEVLGRYLMKQRGQEKYRVLEEDFGEEEYGVGMRKEDTQLKEELDSAIQELRDNGKYQEIYDTWFAE